MACFIFYSSLEEFCKTDTVSSFNVRKNLLVKSSRPGVFFVRRVLNKNSNPQ